MKQRNQAVEEFYIKHYRELCKRVSNRAGGAYYAEDVVQEAFVRALTYWDSYNPERSSIGAWFNTILNNALKDFMQDQRMEGMSTEFEEEVHEPQPMSQTSAHMLRKVESLINKKRDGTRDVLDLYFLHNYKPREICKVLDVNAKAVNMCVLRFKQEVKERYGEV